MQARGFVSAGMSLTHRDLVISLVDLPPDKVHAFATVLDIPMQVVRVAEVNHPRNSERVKSEIFNWIAKNKKITWEDVATALEEPGVDQRNLADEIRLSEYVHIIVLISIQPPAIV